MLSTVDLDDEDFLPTDEIADVSSKRKLAHELATVDLPIANSIPERRLRVRLIDAKPPCDSDGLMICAPHVPGPSPGLLRNPTSPRKERGEVAPSGLSQSALAIQVKQSCKSIRSLSPRKKKCGPGQRRRLT